MVLETVSKQRVMLTKTIMVTTPQKLSSPSQHFSDSPPFLQRLRIIEWVGMDLKDHPVPPPDMGCVPLTSSGHSRDGAPTALGSAMASLPS